MYARGYNFYITNTHIYITKYIYIYIYMVLIIMLNLDLIQDYQNLKQKEALSAYICRINKQGG